MIVFAVSLRVLRTLYDSSRDPAGMTDTRIAEQLAQLARLIGLARCPSSLRSFDNYQSLIVLHRPGLAGAVVIDSRQRAAIAKGRPSVPLRDLLVTLEGEAGADTTARAALALLRAHAADILDDPGLRPGPAPDLVAVDDQLRRDPSDPGQWIASGSAHLRYGDMKRGLQLQRRLSASNYVERESARELLSDLVSKNWKPEKTAPLEAPPAETEQTGASGPLLHVITTLGPVPESRRSPVLTAVQRNLALGEVRGLTVVTESDVTWLRAAFADTRLQVVQVEHRPTFGDLVAMANTLLAEGAPSVCIANADISLGGAADVRKIAGLLAGLGRDGEPAPVLALTRHETEGGTPRIELFEDSGLPNMISADLWAFDRPLNVTRNLFYSLGQMNCDMLFAHDLVSSGHRLFNPCLDVRILHHEDAKEEAFYREANEKQSTQDALSRHATENQVFPWNYYGVPWNRSDWIELGYHPARSSTCGRRLMVAVPPAAESRLAVLLPQLSSVARTHDLEIQLLLETDPGPLLRLHAAAFAAEPRIAVLRVRGSLAETRRAFLLGKQYGFARIAFASDIDRIDDALMTAADCVFVSVRPRPVIQVQAWSGCTLVTSVFRSDPFIRGFLANSRELTGYDRMIEHVFLIAALSDLEADAFNDLLDQQDNALILWHRKDPGLYECWNIGIRLARTDYVSNANVDDLRDPDHVMTLVRDLEANPDCVVAATALNPFYDFPEDGTLPTDRPGWYSDRPGRFGFFDLATVPAEGEPRLDPFNMPHCMPVWRRDLHIAHGWFDEPRFGTFADWAFWLQVLRNGGQGWMDPSPLGFYFVNPTSHNRRGADLDAKHRAVEAEFLPDFLAIRENKPMRTHALRPDLERKLSLVGADRDYGTHRNSFGYLIKALEPLARTDGKGVKLIPFLERQFVWGDAPGEPRSADPRPLTDPWIGILHVPFDAPAWFNMDVSPERFMQSDLWRASRPACRGIITLADDLAKDLRVFDPDLTVLSVRHPTDMSARMFDPAAYRARPRVVQVGDWLRKLQAIHKLRAPGHQRLMLMKQWTSAWQDLEIAAFGDHRDPAVELRHLVPNDEYDDLLATSVVLCQLYATAANNVVIECLARATPILINPLPAAVEYLGRGYPLYAATEAEADALLATPGRVEEAHAWLLRRRTQLDLSYEGFCRDIAASGLYERL